MSEPQLPPNDFAARLQARNAWLEKQNVALRQEQAQLRQSEARYRQVFESAPISIAFISADGCPLEGNRAFEQMYGMTIAQLTEQNFNVFTDPQLVENGTLPYMQRALAGETVIEPPTCYDAGQTVEGGNFSRGQGHYFPIRDGLGRVQEVVEMCLDVTTLYEVQQALLQAEQARSAELERANNALQNTVAALADRCDLDGFIGEVLHAIAREFASPLVEYWTILGADTAEVHTWLYANQLFSRQHNDQHPGRGGIRLLPFINFEDFTLSDQVLVFEEPVPAYSFALGQVICPTEWYAERGASKHFNFGLKVGNLNIGSISVWLPLDQQLTDDQLRLGQALSHQTALAIQLTQLAEEAKQAAIAREQELAAQERAAELAKANEALQQTIDALGCVSEFDEFVPAVLKIVARTFGANVCSYYEHFADETIYLRYWFSNGTVLSAMELQLLDPAQHPTLCKLAEGFTVSPEHLNGATIRNRTRPLVLDHRTMTATPDLHAFAVAQGWDFELNQPLVVDGEAEGAIVIYRPAHQPFTEPEIALLETLAKPLALALQAKRLATQTRERAVEAVIAREQEKAAQERAAELAKANEALKRSLTLLANEPSLDKFLGYVLQTIADRLGDRSGAVYLYSKPHHTTLLHLNYENGHLQQGDLITHPAATLPHPPQAWDDQYLPLLRQNQLLIHHACEFDSPAYAPYRQHNFERGIQTLLIVPMLFGEQLLGSLTLRSTHHRDYTPEELELARALAQQATLAVQLTQLAEQRRQTAVLEERNRMARDIHDTLAQSFTGIILQLEATKSLPNSHCLDIHTSLDCIGELARLGLSEARRSVRALRLEALETTNFFTALRRLLHQITNGTSIHATLAIEGTAQPLPPNLEENLLRIAQEALTNAIRHGHARTITLQLLFEPTTVHLHITDDGNGFDPHSIAFSGFGLLGMQERTQQISGQFHLVSQPEQGTEITVSVPI